MFYSIFSIRLSSMIVIDMFVVLLLVVHRCITFGLHLKVHMKYVYIMRHILFVYLKQVFERLLHKNFKVKTNTNNSFSKFCLACDDIIRAHKLGCLRVSCLHICKETLWVGTSAGVILSISVPQMIDSGNNKLIASSLQLKGLSFGHAGPVRFILSTDTTIVSPNDETSTLKTFVLSIGDGFEDYTNNDEGLGKDDALSHVIVWQL